MLLSIWVLKTRQTVIQNRQNHLPNYIKRIQRKIPVIKKKLPLPKARRVRRRNNASAKFARAGKYLIPGPPVARMFSP